MASCLPGSLRDFSSAGNSLYLLNGARRQDKMMDRYKHLPRQNLIDELVALRQEMDQVKHHAAELAQAAEAYKHTALIIDRSPAILFRRLAADELKQRKMVYVSENISRFGYKAEDFVTNRTMFREILHPEDAERIAKEIQEYVSKKIESYQQVYRILTRDGEVRWIEDHTSVVIDPETGVQIPPGHRGGHPST